MATRAIGVWLLFAGIQAWTGPVRAQDCNNGTTCVDFNELMQYLQSDQRRNSEYRILQARHGQPTLNPRHRQPSNACYYFAIAPILEYLGFARFDPGAHYDFYFKYATSAGLKSHTNDVGYKMSPEHLQALNVYWDSINNLCPTGSSCSPLFKDGDFYSSAAQTTINTNLLSCTRLFDTGQPGYGACSNPATDQYEEYQDHHGNGCGGGGRCKCWQDADCGPYWFANQVLQWYGGCNDMRPFDVVASSSSSSFSQEALNKIHLRRVVKGFIDHNRPLLVNVKEGKHFMVLIGYLDVEGTEALPAKAILTDSADTYFIVDLNDWHQTNNHSLSGLMPWNQYLDGGCDVPDGWAYQLDGKSSSHKLCSMPSGWTGQCNPNQLYGAEVICEDEGEQRARYFVPDGDLFISDPDLISCDKIKLRYADGQHAVESATIQRFFFSADRNEWIAGQTYATDRPSFKENWSHLPGPVNHAVWDANWPDNYWLMAHGLDGNSQRRATITMNLDDGSARTIELSPPGTYGIEVRCYNEGNDQPKVTYAYEADHGVFRVDGAAFSDKQFILEGANRTCDRIEVQANLGADSNLVSATVQRMAYTIAGEWRPLSSRLFPNYNADPYDGLSGQTRVFTWDDAWENNFWLVAKAVGSGFSYGDRKTVIRLLDGHMNLLREIEIVPY